MTAIILRKGPGSEWDNVDPVLAVGEAGFDTTTKKLKIGDGAKKWTELKAYLPEDLLAEVIQDAVASMLDGDYQGLDITYNDTTGKLDIELTESGLYRGVWDTDENYGLDEVTTYDGMLYRSNSAANTTEPGEPNSLWVELISAGGIKLPSGTRVPGQTYPAGSLVKHDGVWFVANKETDATPSFSSTYVNKMTTMPSVVAGEPWQVHGDANAYIDASSAYPGTPPGGAGSAMILRASSFRGDTSVTFTVDMPAGGTVNFDDVTSSEANFDFGEFQIDGVVKHSYAGTGQSWTARSYPLSEGPHVLKWRYSKDTSGNQGQDSYAFTNLSITNYYPEDWQAFALAATAPPPVGAVPMILLEPGASVPAGTPVGAIIIQKL